MIIVEVRIIVTTSGQVLIGGGHVGMFWGSIKFPCLVLGADYMGMYI